MELTRYGSRFEAAMGPPKDAFTLKQERHWRQLRAGLSMLLDDESAVMSRREFEDLDEYSATLPTGVYAGKIWRCHLGVYANPKTATWWLAEYVDDGDPDRMTIKGRRIYLVEA